MSPPRTTSSRRFYRGIMRVTFLIRERQLPGTAMHNAARYDQAHLDSLCHNAQVIAVPEGDRLPQVGSKGELVVIEGAGWVALDQVARLVSRGASVIVRCHAAPEFLYYEFPGPVPTTTYLEQARDAGATLGFVSAELAGRFKGTYLPIHYPVGPYRAFKRRSDEQVDVGCFGAIRPLKNHMGELVAIARAQVIEGGPFAMHINSTRVEGCSTILPELKAAAKAFGVNLVCHDWQEDFRSLARTMTVGLFGSFAESFCLTAADFVAESIPAALCGHIPWAEGARGTDVASLSTSLIEALRCPSTITHKNWRALAAHSVRAERCWNNVLPR